LTVQRATQRAQSVLTIIMMSWKLKNMNRGSGLKPSKFPEPWEISSLSERDVCEEDIKVDRLAALAEHVAPEEVNVPPGYGGDFLQ